MVHYAWQLSQRTPIQVFRAQGMTSPLHVFAYNLYFQCQKIRSYHIIHLDSSCHTSSSVTSSYQSWNLTEWCPHTFFYRWMIGCRSLLINQPLKRRNVSIIVHSTNQRLRTSTCPISRGCWYRNCVGPWCSYSYQTWSRISIGTWFSCSYRPWIRILILGK